MKKQSLSHIEINNRIGALMPKLKFIALRVRGSSSDLDTDELINEMVIALIKKAKSSPTFLNQNTSFILQFAGWQARHAAHSHRRSGSRFFDASFDEPTEAEENYAEAIAIEDDYSNVELSDSIREAIADLHPSYRKLVNLMFLGLPKNEIAEKIGITPGALQDRMQVLRKRLALAMA
jgi:RNA polymerase sigma factor (sigma-70 family)